MEKILKDILIQLEEAGIDCGLIKIEMDEDGGIDLSGEVCSLKEKETVLQIIEDGFGIENIKDELVILEGIVDDGVSGEQKEDISDSEKVEDTEDVYTSIENGVPYTPPSEPIYREDEEDGPRKKK
ncbi:MAG: hypothetical protein P9L90_06695 [Candidatus Aadella gelida]|nr:hypothetical protein [Candidatus Aadella gelida]